MAQLNQQSATPAATMYGQSQPEIAATEERIIATSPAPSGGREEVGFERVTGAATRMAEKRNRIQLQRQQRKVFEENYMRGEAGIDAFAKEAKNELTTRLMNAGVPSTDAARAVSVVVPPKEAYRDMATGTIDLKNYYLRASENIRDFEESIKDRGLEFTLQTMAKRASEISQTATDEREYEAGVTAAPEAVTVAAADVGQAEDVMDFFGRQFEQTSAEEAETELAKTKARAAGSAASKDISPVVTLVTEAEDLADEVAELENMVSIIDAGGDPGDENTARLIASLERGIKRDQEQIQKIGDVDIPFIGKSREYYNRSIAEKQDRLAKLRSGLTLKKEDLLADIKKLKGRKGSIDTMAASATGQRLSTAGVGMAQETAARAGAKDGSVIAKSREAYGNEFDQLF